MPGEYATIGDAMEISQPGDRIEVSPGVYRENNLVMTEGVVLIGMGTGPGDVVLDGGGSGRIILCESIIQSSYIENLTLANGRAFGASSYDQSGGALLSSNSSLRISKCIFSANEAESHGGAIRCNNSTLLINDCLFTGNSAPNGGGGAVDCSYGSSPLFRNCDFENNSASWGGALSCRADSSPMVADSHFKNNTAMGDLGFGGAVFSDFQATPVFTYSTFSGNQALYGGALASFQDAETNLENCTVTGNSAEFSGGGLFCHESSPRVTGSIIAFQEGTGIAAQGGAVPMISCTDLFGNSQGDWVGNISDQAGVQENLSADPVFCSENPLTDNEFSLQDNSPCGPEVNSCGALGAWPVGCDAVAARVTLFEADWSGRHARLSWQTLSNGEAPVFRLTGVVDEEGAKEWEIPYQDEGGGFFAAEDQQSRTDSGKQYIFRLYLVDNRGGMSLLGETKLVAVPDFPGIRDLKASPNPFNPLTSISFNLGSSQRTRVSIYTVDGRRVRTLASREFGSGPQEIKWDGTDENGRHCSTGAYIALVEGERQMKTIKLTLMK
ncbi:MAG: right-handed parallel beta-helix repeat-containing protein [Candidatus Krumholzibacteriota bacterium]